MMNLDPEKFTVVVIATMSSGKSTTLNAMLGLPLLPAKNEACTAILTKVEDVDDMDVIRARVTNVDGDVSTWKTIHAEDDDMLKQWNTAENCFIEIQGDFPHIDNISKNIEFIDTPGPNNSTNRSHAEITHEIISQCNHSYVVFLMNATQFGVDDERTLLEKLFNELKKNNKHTKIVFAVNKMDQLDVDAGETPLKLLETITAYLEGVGFILLLSFQL